jgi:DNA (cytosine-5)-methyltransferase 1
MWKHMARIIGEVRPRYAFVENSPMLTTRGLGVVLADLSSMGFDAKWGVVSAADVGANHQRDRIWIRAEQRNFLSYAKHNRDGRRQQQSESTQETDVVDPKSGGGGRNAGEFQAQNERETPERQKKWVWQFDHASEMANTNEFRTQSQPTNTGKPSEWFDISGIDGRNQEMANTKNERDVWRDWIVGFAQQKHNGTGSEANGCGEWWAVEPNVGRVADGVAARVDRLKAIGNGQVPLCAATAWELLK